MKAEQSSLYRHLETLHMWALDTLENAPKNPAVQADIKLLMENIVNAQSAVAMALNTENQTQKLDFLDVVVMNMTNVKSITKIFTEYSSSLERGKHVISKASRVRLLDIMTQIGSELGRWRNKTLGKINSERAAAPSE